MKDLKNLPLLLLDNSSMMSVLNEGTFECVNLSFEAVKHLLEIHDEDNVLRCFANTEIETIILITSVQRSGILSISEFATCALVRMLSSLSFTSRLRRRNRLFRRMTA